MIGLGGGTALDIAKLVAALAESPGDMADYLLAKTPWAGRVPAVMVPTTSGTGSEVTRTSILTDPEGRKLWAWGDELLPDAVLLDPALTLGLPATLTATTGLDAFVHALEATTGQGQHTFIEATALQAIRLVGAALPMRWPPRMTWWPANACRKPLAWRARLSIMAVPASPITLAMPWVAVTTFPTVSP